MSLPCAIGLDHHLGTDLPFLLGIAGQRPARPDEVAAQPLQPGVRGLAGADPTAQKADQLARDELLLGVAGAPAIDERERLGEQPGIRRLGLAPAAGDPASAALDEAREPRAALDQRVAVGADTDGPFTISIRQSRGLNGYVDRVVYTSRRYVLFFALYESHRDGKIGS